MCTTLTTARVSSRLTNLAMTDAVITAWDTKITLRLLAAHHGRHEADNDGNPETISDANCQPLANTPNYPDYTSGANNATGAVTRALALFFGTDEMTFTVATTYPLSIQRTRTYDRFWAAASDVVNARIFEGIHFRFADARGNWSTRIKRGVFARGCGRGWSWPLAF
jgi:hypothetical protein